MKPGDKVDFTIAKSNGRSVHIAKRTGKVLLCNDTWVRIEYRGNAYMRRVESVLEHQDGR